MRKSVVIGLVIGVIVVAAGVFGPGALTASGAEPNFCASCHVMDKNVHSYQTTASAHKDQVSCSDCHLPTGATGWAAHYTTGARHIWTTATGRTPAALELTAADQKLVVANCVRCHAEEDHIKQNGKTACLTCHANDPHGEKGVNR
ncbi:MAG TPA: NapC/NirT family cytochrome c [Symbiobacteriaceae bacterium]|jgi:cytochrome c nitrite reductase small subunit